MYYLSRTNQINLLTNKESEAWRARASAIQLLNDSNRGLIFDQVEHKYYLGGRELDSVSTIKDEYGGEFDAEKMAIACSKNPKHKLYGMDPIKIQEMWTKYGEEAAKNGTKTHEFAEACFLCKEGNEQLIEGDMSQRCTAYGLAAATGKEIAAANWWDCLDLNRYVLVAKETQIVNPILEYAGTFDLLLYDLAYHHYVLKDYKTNNELFKDYGKRLKAPLSTIPANDHGKYTVQQNLYKIQLDNIGLYIGQMDLIWLHEDGSWQEVPIQDYSRLIRMARENDLKKSKTRNRPIVPTPEKL